MVKMMKNRSVPAARVLHRQIPSCGFTLIELLSIMAIMVILLSIAAASSVHWGRATRMRSSVQKIKSSIDYTRQWAVTHQVPTAFVFTNDPSSGRGCFVITNAIHGQIGNTQFLANGIAWTNTTGALLFLADGSSAGSTDMELVIAEFTKGANGLASTIIVYRVTGYAKLQE